MEDAMTQVLILATLIAPIAAAVMELVKRTVKLPNNLIPLITVVVGLVVGVVFEPFTELDLVLRLWAGGLAGLAGTGLYELITKRSGTSN